MRRLLFLLGLVMFIAAAAAGCGAGKEQPEAEAEPVNLIISAAASLKDAAEELKDIYITKHPEVNITYNFASSGTLQKQIEEGAPADVFISAGKPQMDALAEKDLIVKETRQDLLSNEIVLITQSDSNLAGFEELAGSDVEKISIGTPESVPAGKYAKEALISLGLWEKIQPKLVFAKDVRQVLTYAETGNVDAGLVYRSDTVIGEGIKIVAAAPAGSHKPIVYPMAVIKGTGHPEEAKAFTEFISGEEAAQIFTKYGFKPLNK
ncbi:molybdate ABC transporter substrate-binding protein [Desulfoscipio geothermicus]|uniref:Molybdate transport system substrate-binding protein n=1 Tax=Desulfoscipio geothermicus DSM 3669 TaxID=1121426 RepID=A0A1I6DJW0_9FIRM|nr:molybdate ABC transporter substrate-binding protein [Desulfoscipio geothermicus]SFR05667.1 molybdate transport system substrate-binding protein [Desulfoscipio geothermicus DSM 3669]